MSFTLRLLLSIQLVCLSFFSLLGQADFNFNNGSLSDNSPLGIDGTGFNLSSAIGLEEDNNTAFSFNGSSSYINLTNDNRGIIDQLTLSVWIKTNSADRRVIVSKYDMGTDAGYSISIQDGMASFEGRDGSGIFYQLISEDLMINDGEWHHLVGIVDKNVWKLYTDCMLVNTHNTTTLTPDLSSPVPLTIGRLSVANGFGEFRYFNGSIDNVKLYNSPLSEEQLKQISRYTCPNVPPDILSGLIAHYPLDGDALDFSGNNLHGTLNGAVPVADRFNFTNAALAFDGTDDFILVNHDELFDFGFGEFSISLWVQSLSPDGGPQMLLQKGISGGETAQFWVRLNEYDPPNRLVGLLTDGNPPATAVSSSDALFDDQEWHHLVYQRTATDLELWVDCKMVAQFPLLQNRDVTNTGNLIIGAQNPWPPGGNHPFFHNHFAGLMDEVRIYNRALSEPEIIGVSNTYCPEDLVVQEDLEYCIYQADNTLSTEGEVLVAAPTIFKAGESIQLLPGFQVEPGIEFVARIEDCTPSTPINANAFRMPEVVEAREDIFQSTQNLSDYVLQVSPNPVRSELNISIDLQAASRSEMWIRDLNGRTCKKIFSNVELTSSPEVFTTDVSELPPGMYLVVLQTENYHLTKKIIKIR